MAKGKEQTKPATAPVVAAKAPRPPRTQKVKEPRQAPAHLTDEAKMFVLMRESVICQRDLNRKLSCKPGRVAGRMRHTRGFTRLASLRDQIAVLMGKVAPEIVESARIAATKDLAS